jgi:phosphoglycolate phosphatase
MATDLDPTDAAWPSDTPLRLVMFDLDGTLSDSAPGILASLRHAFAVNDLPPLDEPTARALLGPPFYESLPPLIGGPDRLPAVIDAYRDQYGRVGMFDTSVYAGVPSALAALRAVGIPMAVATSKPEHYAVPIVEHFGLAGFFATVGGDELDGSLPTKALVIDKVLARMGRPDPAAVVMVGDRSHDVEGAREHDIAAVGAGWGYAVPGELAAAQPWTICATPPELTFVLGLDSAGVTAL